MTQALLLDQPAAADLSHVEPDVPRAVAVAETNPFTLLERAVERGMEPAQLRELVALHEQWRAARAREAFNAAMTAVQVEMPCIVRDAQNTQTKSSYVRLETVTHQAKPIYTRNGFALSFSEDKADRDGWKRLVCDISHVQGHSERRWIELPVDGVGAKGNAIGAMNPVQAAISTGSYGQRVLTCRIFNITIADSDLDGQAPNPPANPDAPKAQPRANRQAPEVTKEMLNKILYRWRGHNPEPSGDKAAWNQRWAEFVSTVLGPGRSRQVMDVSDWTLADYDTVDLEIRTRWGE